MTGRRLPAVAAAAMAVFVLSAAPASASFHLMSVREVYPGSVSAPQADYVELQMYAGGQNFVGGHVLKVFDAGGALVQSTVFAGDVANGANQSTILLATPQAEAQFGFAADQALGADLTAAGGAVCWESLDCVSWGGFSGGLPSPAGAPAAPAGIPDGMALRRRISAGCATLLEASDDTNSSAADLEAVFPEPRPNSVAPSEHLCASSTGNRGGGGGAGGAGRGVPRTRLSGKPRRRTHDRTPTFRFSSDERPARFACKLDRGRFRRCRSPFTTRKLRFGRHTFRVRATHEGVADPSPAVWRFRVVPRR